MASARQVLTIGGITLLTAGLSYCLYFDYKRRNDPVFRKKLLKEQRRLIKKSQVQDKYASRELEKMLAAAVDAVNAEPLPTTVDGKEQFFMEHVGMGEMLASKMPQGAMPAAIAFFKAYKVYPSPQELMLIYQRTMPAEIFAIIVEMIKLDVNRVLNRGSYSSSGPRRPSESDGPVIEEITGEERAAIESRKSTPSKPSSTHSKPASAHGPAPQSNSSLSAKPSAEPSAEKLTSEDLLTASSSKAPSENGSLMAASQTANSFIMVDEHSSTGANQAAEVAQADLDSSYRTPAATSTADENTHPTEENPSAPEGDTSVTDGDTAATEGNTSAMAGYTSASEENDDSQNPSADAEHHAESSAESKEQHLDSSFTSVAPPA